MTTVFFRLLEKEEKASVLADVVAAARDSRPRAEVHLVDPQRFRQIPGSPFAYWVTSHIRHLFSALAPLESDGREAQSGASTMNDFRFLRAWWEIYNGLSTGNRPATLCGQRWVPFAKGGAYSPYYFDCELVVDWMNDGQTIKDEVAEYRGKRGWGYQWTAAINGHAFYFRPGLTWPRRTQGGLSVRALPEGCIFGDKGPTVFAPNDDKHELWALLGLMNSRAFRGLVDLQMTFGSFEVGVLERTPVPLLAGPSGDQLADLARECVEAKRQRDQTDETRHIFLAVGAVHQPRPPRLHAAIGSWSKVLTSLDERIRQNQADIDALSFELYGFSDADRHAIDVSLAATPAASEAEENGESVEPSDLDDARPSPKFTDTAWIASALLSYSLGVVVGRWDVRVAIEGDLAPKLQDPFERLPVCPPGMLVGPNGLPAGSGGIVSKEWLRARPNAITLPPEGAVPSLTIPDREYPLRIVWEGILADDDEHEDDVVRCVRSVLELLWPDDAPAFEQEVCEILGVKSLREYFRNPKHFWDDHVRRYSKSRRKAPIYWMLQSPERHYALWIYYHRLDKDIYFKALRNYVDPKIRLEQDRLKQLQDRLGGTPEGRERKMLEKQIDEREAVVNDVLDFKELLEKVAQLGPEPDLNDGVILNIAPLHELVPWKEPKEYWDELLAGKYEWSTIGKQLRERRLVRG